MALKAMQLIIMSDGPDVGGGFVNHEPKLTSEARERLKQAFLSLYERRPLHKISVLDIISEAGYARGTFYRHFSGREDLLQQIEEENTCTPVCRHIIDNVNVIPLEDATDMMASFYESRVRTVAVLAKGSNGNNYLDAQRVAMKPMFAALLGRAYVMTPMQADVVSEYIASAKVGMIRLWLEKRQLVSLSQISKMSEVLVEPDLWTFVARQAPLHGGPLPLKVLEDKPFNYPWLSQ